MYAEANRGGPDLAQPIPHHDWIAGQARLRPDGVATVDLHTGRTFTYAQLHRRVGLLAGALRQHFGLCRGDRVAVLAHNGTDMFELQFACARIGAIFVPLNWRLAPPELQAILTDCAPALLVSDPADASVAESLAAASLIRRTLALGAPYETAIANAAPVDAAEDATLGDVATILYTSGTTGQPKGVIVTHGMNLWNAVNVSSPARLSPDTVFLCLLPLFHTGGLNVFANPVFHAGGTVLVMRDFDPAATLRVLQDRERPVTHLFGVPAHYQLIAQHPAFSSTDLSGIRFAAVGAAPTPDSLLETWATRGLVLQQGYGMTETGPVVLLLDRADAVRKAGAAGKPVLHTDVRLVRPDGTEACAHEVGELWVRGPNVTPGYWGQPAATAAAFTDGWLRTGDAARRDEEGFYTIVDRWKDMYISGGENVYPAEVENVLYQIDAVAEAAIIGVPDERWGEVGRAVAVLKPGRAATEAELLAHCAANLGRFKLPRSIVFTDALPRNATGKVHKPTLRAMFAREDATPGAGTGTDTP